MRKKARKQERVAIAARRKAVGEFVRRRRRELKLSRTTMMKLMGYKSIMSLADVELGRVGVPFKRIYQYADILRLPRDEFVRFVIGGIQGPGKGGSRSPAMKASSDQTVTGSEQALIDDFRRLPNTYRQRVRALIRECLVPRGKRAGGVRRKQPRVRRAQRTRPRSGKAAKRRR